MKKLIIERLLVQFRERSLAASLKPGVAGSVDRERMQFRERSLAASLKPGSAAYESMTFGSVPRAFARGLIEAWRVFPPTPPPPPVPRAFARGLIEAVGIISTAATTK